MISIDNNKNKVIKTVKDLEGEDFIHTLDYMGCKIYEKRFPKGIIMQAFFDVEKDIIRKSFVIKQPGKRDTDSYSTYGDAKKEVDGILKYT